MLAQIASRNNLCIIFLIVNYQLSVLGLEVEFHVHGFGSLFGGGEVAFLLEAQHACDEAGGEAAQLGVVGLDGFVEFAALDGDAVLGALKLGLQVAEALGGSEFGVALDGDLDGVGEGLGEVVLGFLVGADLFFGELRGVHLGLLHAGAGVGDLGEDALLVVGGTFHGVDELRDEVHAAFVDVLDLAPGLGDVLFVGYEAVVDADAPEEDEGHDAHDGEDGDGSFFHFSDCFSSLTRSGGFYYIGV